MKKSFMKWAGGKKSALPKISQIMPMEGGVLIEPFVGSATVSLNTDFERYVLSDVNSDVIHLYQMVMRSPRSVINEAKKIFVDINNTKPQFYALKSKYNTSNDKDTRALLLLYLNRHCFNGLMRYNKSNEFNTSFGSFSKPYVPENEIMDFYRHFKGRVQFKSLDFQKARFHASEDVQVYLDPPYLPISKTASFAAYSENGFDLNDHKSLSKKCRQWSSRGCSVWLSNHAVPILKDIYPCASEYHYFMVPRVISQNTSSRLPVKEVLIQY